MTAPVGAASSDSLAAMAAALELQQTRATVARMKAVLEREKSQIAALRLQLAEAKPQHRQGLEAQVRQVKRAARIELLRIQLEAARNSGDVALAEQLAGAIELLSVPARPKLTTSHAAGSPPAGQ